MCYHLMVMVTTDRGRQNDPISFWKLTVLPNPDYFCLILADNVRHRMDRKILITQPLPGLGKIIHDYTGQSIPK